MELPGFDAAFAELSRENFSDFMALDYHMYFVPEFDRVRKTAEESREPARQAAARALLWAVTRELPEDVPIPKAAVRERLLRVSKDAAWYRAQPDLRHKIEEAREWLDRSSTALVKAEPAKAAPPKIQLTRHSFDGIGHMEVALDPMERSVAVMADRDSELGTLFGKGLKLSWSASGALRGALAKVETSKAQPLVAATILHEAASKLDEPKKAELMFRFIDANLHPDFQRHNTVSEEQRRNTAKAVEALFGPLGWGSTPVEQAVRSHLDARMAGEPVPAPRPLALAAAPAAETALAVRDSQSILAFKPTKALARKYRIGVMASFFALIVSSIGGSPLAAFLAMALLVSLYVSFVYTFKPAAPVVETDPHVLEAMKELDAEFPTMSDEELDRRIGLLEDPAAKSKGGSQ
jgi:hypothetical protein